MEIYKIYVYRDLTGMCILPKGLLTVFCVQKITEDINFWGRGNRGFWLCDVAILVMYCIDAPQMIVTQPVYRTALPFSILNGFPMDQIIIKTPNLKFRLYWCLIEFIDWRYSQS